MIPLPSRPVLDVSWPEDFCPTLKVVDAASPKDFEINEVPDVFLNRPPILDSSSEELLRNDGRSLLEPQRRPPKPLDDFGGRYTRDSQLKNSIEPDSTLHIQSPGVDGFEFSPALCFPQSFAVCLFED